MTLDDAFDEIITHSHFWNWAPDWDIVRSIYESHPNSYSVLIPFAYSYLEEVIRTTTSEYGIQVFDESGVPLKNRKVGMNIVNLAIKENAAKNLEYTKLLNEIKKYFKNSTVMDKGDNRHSVAHGYMHPRFWDDESFENLIIDIARLSKYSNF
jgi:hypothetical protein